MAGGYEPEQYQRDVVRLRIIRSQQEQQIKVQSFIFYCG